MKNRILYSCLTQYGNFFPLKISFDGKSFVEYTEKHFAYKRYNPRKEINRYGLSLTSLDGGTSGVPDLDSLIEYNNEHGLELWEEDFYVKTEAFTDKLQYLMKGFDPYIFRSHVLKIPPGGFFPPHRDQISDIKSFRIIVPLKNCTMKGMYFLLENKKLEWEEGRFYFLDTVKTHCLFNASSSLTSYWLVFNIGLCRKTFYNIVDLVYQ